MSDTPQNEGWWLASDGKWYPPAETEPAAPEPSTPTTPWWKRAIPLWAVVIIFVTGVGLGAAGAGDAGETEAADAMPALATEDDPGEREGTTSTRPATTSTSRPATTTSTVPTTTTTTAPPRPGFGGGTQVVGTDVQPGLYIATDASGCYWERLSGLSGEFGDILANDNAVGQAIVEIGPSDVAFNSQRCGRWELYEPPAAPVDSFGDGDWVVGEQIAPGRYRAEVTSSCYWERASGFAHDFGEITANDIVQQGNAIVEIAPGDRRFTTTRCGTWVRQ